jgi:hypothetical protein
MMQHYYYLARWVNCWSLLSRLLLAPFAVSVEHAPPFSAEATAFAAPFLEHYEQA